ncbi:Beta-lactamase class D [Pseudomonas syringae pv. actinidiae]|uniref:Beta-lactamase class D n=1 Tax=Pseudomonas syringae pv. actinidiae TaxID=103796 RepID=A0A2V0QBM2_PSESF|nr:Beta-lactamase class D [Pseudomonas syringae pv. actinidiae]
MAKSPGEVGVVAVISGVVHVVILSVQRDFYETLKKYRALKKQNPRSGSRPGVENSLVGVPLKWAPDGYQARQWLNQYP